MSLINGFLSTFLQTIWDVLPIAFIIVVFQVGVLRRAVPNVKRVALGFLYVLLGLAFFLQGLEQALFPLGELMATQLTSPEFLGLPADGTAHWWQYYWVYL